MSRELLPGYDGQMYLSFGSKANCTLDVCPIEYTIYKYQPNKVINIALTVIFALIMVVHIALGIRWKTWGYMTSMILGCLFEIAGYACRVILHNNPFKFMPFVIQNVALTIAPVFYTAGIYVTLSQSIHLFAPDMTRVKPVVFVWVFLTADITCLVLQAAGGALSVTGTKGSSSNHGNKVSQAGLSFQLVVLVGFMIAFADFYIRLLRSGRLAKIEWRLIAFITGMTTSVVIILARCAFRVYELKEGYSGDAITHEVPFVIAEGVFMVIAAAALFWGHPGLALKPSNVQYPAAGKGSGSDSDDSAYPSISKGAYPHMSQPAFHAVDRPSFQAPQHQMPAYQMPAQQQAAVHQQMPTYQMPARNDRATHQAPVHHDRPSYQQPPTRSSDRPSYPPVPHNRPAYNNLNGQRPVIGKPQMQYRPAHI